MKALVMGYYGLKNLGDEMMLFCLRRQLEARGFQLTVLTAHPEEVEKLHHLPTVRNWPLLGQWAWRSAWFRGGAPRVIQALAENDAFVMGGGDIIRDDLGWRTFSFSIEKVILAILLRKKVYLLNVGLGVPQTWYGRFLLRWILPRCEEIVVRDYRSLAICREMSARNARFALDIVFSLPELIGDKAQTSTTYTGRPYILVCLRGNPNAFHLYDFNPERIRKFASCLDTLVEQYDVDVLCMPFQQFAKAGLDDNDIHRQVGEEMKNRKRIEILPWTADFREVCDRFRNARCVISMRLHAAVLAVAYARPCTLMPLDHKLRQFAEVMNLSHIIEAATLDDSATVHAVIDSALITASTASR
jgi:polysaccharide pyruvyl transferase CsaB